VGNRKWRIKTDPIESCKQRFYVVLTGNCGGKGMRHKLQEYIFF